MTPEDIIASAAARRGHFLLESGHHGDLWLDPELLCLHPRELTPTVAALAERLRPYNVDVVCGPLNEGAFIALMVASKLDVGFTYAERFEQPQTGGLFPVQYRLPPALRPVLSGKRLAIVNDVINAGSAVRGTHADLLDCGAIPVALTSLLVLGGSAARLAREWDIPLISLAHHENQVWAPEQCPLCAAGVPLDVQLPSNAGQHDAARAAP